MSAWRLELLRLWRTGRLIALVATFLILGFGLPILTYYLPDLIKNAGNGVEITLPKQTAADSMIGFAGNVGQLGTLVVVVVAAANLAIDARTGLAAFYRTRIRQPVRLISPRYVVVTVASAGALLLGTLGAWYETVILFGPLDFGDLVVGLALEAVWFCFVTSIVTGLCGLVRSVLGVVGGSIAFLLALALLGNIPWFSSWLPTRLASGSAAPFVEPPAADLWHAVVVSIVAAIAAFGLGIYGLGRREV